MAEFCSAFLISEVGLPNIEPQAIHIKVWLRVRNDAPAMLVFAASAGQAAVDYSLEDNPAGAPRR